MDGGANNPAPDPEPQGALDRTPGAANSAPRGAEGNAMFRFTLITGAWFVGLFGLMRLPWVERVLLTPFAEVQQRVADQLTGAPSDLVYAGASCSGGDPLVLCAGAIFVFPATWGSRLRAVAVGFTIITAFNIVRLGHLSLIAENRALLDLLHLYVWPGILILVAAGFVYAGWAGRASSPGAALPRARARNLTRPRPVGWPWAVRPGASCCWRRCSWRSTSPPRPSSTRARSSTSWRVGSW